MINVENLTRSYGDFKAVDDVSFEIQRGEVVGLLGHNGAGKTTIMKVLTGFLEPSSGRITLEGRDLAEQRRMAQRLIGYLPENCPLYPDMTVIDFLEYQAGMHGIPEARRLAAVRHAIARTELESRAANLIGTLSRGYRQRVGVAQAILHEPDILILDEPTNGLDPTQIQHMRSLIRELARNAIVLLSTHILQEVEATCDRVLIIRNGRLALDARLGDLDTAQHLVVGVDAGPEKVQALLKGVDGVRAIRYLPGAIDGRHQYALEAADLIATAPRVAHIILNGGLKLYRLQPERRDLETIFGEINDPLVSLPPNNSSLSEAVHA
ncbi:ABC-2 type transport system ATP-binding protein [Gammaproteobacteria bacterium]